MPETLTAPETIIRKPGERWTPKPDELAEILRLHRLWVLGDKEGRRGNLRSANLRSANLSSANLSSANLSFADLSSANLSFADLSSANLSSANLSFADLSSANLSFADLSSANLSFADLSAANLSSANLSAANLSAANLRSANLIVSWQSHALLSEIIWRAAETEPQQMLAAFIGRKTDWCWGKWAAYQNAEMPWAIHELAKWIKPNDGAPDELVEAVKKLEGAK